MDDLVAFGPGDVPYHLLCMMKEYIMNLKMLPISFIDKVGLFGFNSNHYIYKYLRGVEIPLLMHFVKCLKLLQVL